MTKGERRRLRKTAGAEWQSVTGDPSDADRGGGPVEFGPERLPDGGVNAGRARALERWARQCYDYDRD